MSESRRLITLGSGLATGIGLGILILFGLGGWDLLVGYTRRENAPRTVLQAGSAAPDFELETLSGEQIKLSDLRGSMVILNFWATWCGPCQAEMPLFQARYEQYAPRLRVLAVNFAEPVENVQAFVDELGLTFDILLDPKAMVQQMYAVRGYPTTYIIDSDGIIQYQHLGVMSENQLDRYLNNAGLSQ